MLFISTVGIAEQKNATPSKSGSLSSPTPLAEPREVSGLGVDEASELLDWLECRGINKPVVEADSFGRLTIRWEEVFSN